MKRTLAIIMALTFLGILAGAVIAADAPDVIKMSKNFKGGLDFTHAKHVEYVGGTCKDCHHTGENTKCTGCHDATGEKGGGLKNKDAFHKQCTGCHKDKGKGPTSCNDCHSYKVK